MLALRFCFSLRLSLRSVTTRVKQTCADDPKDNFFHVVLQLYRNWKTESISVDLGICPDDGCSDDLNPNNVDYDVKA
jgi:hypothetical protein